MEINAIMYWRFGAGYRAMIGNSYIFALDPQEFLNLANHLWPDQLFEIVPKESVV